MKKLLVILSVVLLAFIGCVFTFHHKKTFVAATHTKTIDVAVYTSNNYALDAYNSSVVGLNVTVTNAKSEVVWKKDYPALQLKQIPSLTNAFKPRIDIPVSSHWDKFEVTYTLNYNSNGNTLQLGGNKIVGLRDKNTELFINI